MSPSPTDCGVSECDHDNKEAHQGLLGPPGGGGGDRKEERS